MPAPVQVSTNIHDGPLPAGIRARMLECGLWDRTARRSALLDLWTGRAPGLQVWSDADGLEISLAWLTPDDPLGVLVLECRTDTLYASVPAQSTPAFREIVVRVVGAISIYVKPEIRGRGIARDLVRAAEEQRVMSTKQEAGAWGPDVVPAVVANGAALSVVRSSARWFAAIPSYHASVERDEALRAMSASPRGAEGKSWPTH